MLLCQIELLQIADDVNLLRLSFCRGGRGQQHRGAGAAMLLPATAAAKRKAQSINIISNLKQLDLAKNMWAEENNKPGDAVATMDDLKPYLGKDFPQSIAGEKYDVGRVIRAGHGGH